MAAKGADFPYWTRWQFPVCAAVVAVPAFLAVFAIYRSEPANPLRYSDLWKPCWRRVHPLWLLAYRAAICAALAYVMFRVVVWRGASVFFFYTEWTFALVIIYFVIATIISAHGCWIYTRGYAEENEEVLKRLLEGDFEENLPAILMSRTNENNHPIKLQNYHEKGDNFQSAGFWGYTMQIVYQTCGGAVVLTDIVFWGLLVLLFPSKYFKINLVTGCMHSLILVFLLVDAAFNRLEIIKGLPKELKIVDLSADFQLRDIDEYAEWYGQPHKAPELQEEYRLVRDCACGLMFGSSPGAKMFDMEYGRWLDVNYRHMAELQGGLLQSSFQMETLG